jgi:hypothetical protein
LPDIFSYDIVVALDRPGCPICYALAADESRWIASFWREGKDGPESRTRFLAAGGFCRRHAWFLHRICVAERTGAAIADVYGLLVERDLRWLDSVMYASGSRRRGQKPTLRRNTPCPACVAFADAVDRKTAFFIDAISEDPVRRRYVLSDGLCFEHFAQVVDTLDPGDSDMRRFLIEDWRRRLHDLADQLAEYDGKRDYRRADEPKGAEQHSWTDVIRRYVGHEGQL